jgi:hypothetical protein
MGIYIAKSKNISIPEGMQICHSCLNRHCVAFDHLRMDSRKGNMSDKVKSGTSNHGKGTNLDIEQARLIKYSKNTGTQRERALRFNVSLAIVNNIDRCKSWGWLGKTVMEDNKYTPSVEKKNPRYMTEPEHFTKAQMMIKSRTLKDDHFCSTLNSFCWLFQGYKDSHGYGSSTFMSKSMGSHVLSYKAFNQISIIPSKMIVRHKCTQKSCCNPEHLEIGTAKDNADDRIRDGTWINNRAKITEETAILIKNSKGTATMKARVLKYGTTLRTVAHIDSGKTWKNINLKKRKMDDGPIDQIDESQIKCMKLENLNQENST